MHNNFEYDGLHLDWQRRCTINSVNRHVVDSNMAHDV